MIPGIPKPCLDCQKLTHHGTRCENCHHTHQQKINQARPPRPKYSGQYRQAAAQVVATATVCYLCGQPPTTTDPLQADHIIEGQYDSPLAAAHRSCNIRKYQAWKRQQKKQN